MTRRNQWMMAWTVGVAVLVTGCMPKMTIEELKEMMPQRPAELDKLNAFAGNWTMEGEARMAGLDEVLKTSGSSESKWEGDGWYLVGRLVFSMGELGETQGLETWTYDTKSRKYRSTWVDSMGSIGTGESTHDEKTNTWQFKANMYGPFGRSTGKGTARVVDDNTLEWTWTEYSGLMKTMEMTGTSRRQ